MQRRRAARGIAYQSRWRKLPSRMKCRGSEQISTTCTFPVIIMPICPARKPFNYSRTLSYLSIPSICSLIISQSLNQINQFPSLCHHLVFYISVSGSAQHHFFFFYIFVFFCLFVSPWIFHFDSNFLHCIQMKLIVIFGWSSYLSSFNVILIDTLLL